MHRKPLPSVEDLLNHLEYRRESGELYWKVPTGTKAKVGKKVGGINQEGYKYVKFKKTQHLAHRIIWKMEHREEPPEIIDHIDRVRTNNVITNLRAATQSLNQLNRDDRGHGASGVKGVTWDKNRKKWSASIRINKETTFLGRFKNIEDAKQAYKNAFPTPQDVIEPEETI